MGEDQNINLKTIEDLYKSNHKMLCNIANRIINNREVSEDIVQEVFIKLWQKRNELRIDSTLKGYIYKSVTNASLNYLESNKTVSLKKELTFEMSESLSDPDHLKLDQRELESRINEAIERLPAKCKTIFILSRYEEMKYKDIAIQLDLSLKTIENQMGIALEKLRNDLKPYLTREFLLISFIFIYF